MERIERTLEEHALLRRGIWMLLVAGLVFFRLPERFLDPFMFAEEGRVYFRWAYHHDVLDALRTTKLGYFSFWPNLACTLAAHAVPLESAPLVTTLMGTSIVLLMVVLLALPSSPLQGHLPRLVGATALLLMPVHYGKAHTTFAMYYLSFCTALVLVSEPRSSRERWILRGTLLLAATTGSSSLFLSPLFLWKYLFQGRSRELLVQMAILFACGVLQLSVVAHTMAYFPQELSSERWASFEPGVFSGAVGARALVANLAGLDAMRAYGGWLHAGLLGDAGLLTRSWAMGVACASFVLAFMVMRGPRSAHTRETRLLSWGFVLMTVLSFVSAITNQEGTKSGLLLEHDRYYVAPCLMFSTAVLLHAFRTDASVARWWYRLGLAWMLAVGAFAYLWQRPAIFEGGPSWPDEVAAWRQDERRPMHVWPISPMWPEGWMFHLRPARRARALEGGAATSGPVQDVGR